MQRLQAEQLEGREVLSAVLADGVLTFTASDNGALVAVNPAADGAVQVVYDLDLTDGAPAVIETFEGVTRIEFVGGAGQDVFLNNTAVEDVAAGGAGGDLLVGGFGASSALEGADGGDFLIARAARNTVDAGAGADTVLLLAGTDNVVLSGASDVLFGVTAGVTQIAQDD